MVASRRVWQYQELRGVKRAAMGFKTQLINSFKTENLEENLRYVLPTDVQAGPFNPFTPDSAKSKMDKFSKMTNWVKLKNIKMLVLFIEPKVKKLCITHATFSSGSQTVNSACYMNPSHVLSII